MRARRLLAVLVTAISALLPAHAAAQEWRAGVALGLASSMHGEVLPVGGIHVQRALGRMLSVEAELAYTRLQSSERVEQLCDLAGCSQGDVEVRRNVLQVQLGPVWSGAGRHSPFFRPVLIGALGLTCSGASGPARLDVCAETPAVSLGVGAAVGVNRRVAGAWLGLEVRYAYLLTPLTTVEGPAGTALASPNAQALGAAVRVSTRL